MMLSGWALLQCDYVLIQRGEKDTVTGMHTEGTQQKVSIKEETGATTSKGTPQITSEPPKARSEV